MRFINLFGSLITLTLLLNPSITFSQNQNKPPDRMKMLTAFNGEWEGEMNTVKDTKTLKYKLSHTSEKIAGGWGIQLTEVAIIPQKGKYQAARIFSYSATSDSTFMYTIDNFGATWFFIGTWESSKKLVLRSKSELNGKVTEKEIVYQFMNPKQYNYKSITRESGKTDEMVEMTMNRQ